MILQSGSIHDAPSVFTLELWTSGLDMEAMAVARMGSLRLFRTGATELRISSMALSACPMVQSISMSDCQFSDRSHVEAVLDWVPQTATVWLASLHDAIRLLMNPDFKGAVACLPLPAAPLSFEVVSVADRYRILAWIDAQRFTVAPFDPLENHVSPTTNPHMRTIHRILSASR